MDQDSKQSPPPHVPAGARDVAAGRRAGVTDAREARIGDREARADARDKKADAREVEADRRQVEADAREAAANYREAEADQREAEADAREAEADEREVAADRHDEATGAGKQDERDVRARHRRVRHEAGRRRAAAGRRRAEWRLAERRTQVSEQDSLFAAIGEQLFDAPDLSGVVTRIVTIAGSLMPAADLASMTVLDSDGRLQTPAFTDELAIRLDEAQYGAGDGPCVDATRAEGTGLARCDDLAGRDVPWPGFAGVASELGVRSVVSVGLLPASDGPRLGALNFYAFRPGVLAELDVDMAILLAAHLSTALTAWQRLDVKQRYIDNLRQALESRQVIGIAQGLLMAQQGGTPDEAFEVLSATSQRLNIKVRELARRMANGQPLDPGRPPS